MHIFWLVVAAIGAVAFFRAKSSDEDDAHFGKELKAAEIVEPVDEDEELTNRIIAAAQQAGICKREIEANTQPKLKKDKEDGQEA